MSKSQLVKSKNVHEYFENFPKSDEILSNLLRNVSNSVSKKRTYL